MSYTIIKQEPSSLQVFFKSIRESLNMICETTNDAVVSGTAHFHSAVSELREEENISTRVAVIGGATVVGLAVGSLRGRRVSRALFSLVGGGSGSIICYPEVAQGVQDVAKNVAKVVSGDGGMESLSVAMPVVDPVVVMATMKTSLQTLLTKCQEVYSMAAEAVKSDPPKSELMAEKPSTEAKAASVLFLPSSSLTPTGPVEEDHGMGTEEDKDMYTTRG